MWGRILLLKSCKQVIGPYLLTYMILTFLRSSYVATFIFVKDYVIPWSKEMCMARKYKAYSVTDQHDQFWESSVHYVRLTNNQMIPFFLTRLGGQVIVMSYQKNMYEKYVYKAFYFLCFYKSDIHSHSTGDSSQ